MLLRAGLLIACFINAHAQPPRSPVHSAISASAASPADPLSELIKALDAPGRARALAALDALNPDTLEPSALLELSEAYRLLGRSGDALKAAAALSARDANDPAGDKQSILALAQAGDYAAAQAAAERGLKRFPGDPDFLALLHQVKGRSAGVSPAAAPLSPTVARDESTAARPSILTGRAPKKAPLSVPGVSVPDPERANDRVASLADLELEQSAYNALREAVSAAPMPVSAARSAFDRSSAVVERDLKLRQAAQAASEWLSRSQDPKARTLLDGLSDSRRTVLGDALSRASALMDRTEAGREDARVRSVLMSQDASPDARAEAVQTLLALRRQDPGYFKAKAAALDYVRFNREHLADFPAKTRFSGAELGMEPPPDSGLSSIEYETTKGGRLVAARLISADGSSRERAEVAGAWTVRDKSGAVTGWTLDAGAFAALEDPKARGESVAASARWLSAQGFKPGGHAEQSDAAASVLSDLLGRTDAGVKGVQVYADRAEGRIVIDAYYGHGIKQKVVRYEPGEAGQAPGLVLYERTVADPSDATTPWRKAMLYRGAGERELMTAKAVSNGDSLSRAVTGTTVELVPVAVGYRRGEDGRWTRDGRTREFPEQRQVIHDSAGVIGGSGDVLGVAGRGTTDLAASAFAAGGALSLYPARAVPRIGSLVSEVQQDWFERAGVNLVNNAVSTELGERYQGDAYKDRKTAMNLDQRKYVQNVRQELTEQGHPLLGAVAGGGVGFANSVLPMAAGIGAVHQVAQLGWAGRTAAAGVGLVWSGRGGWDYGTAVNEFGNARSARDENDPVAMATYYTAVQNLTQQTIAAPLLFSGLTKAVKGRLYSTSQVEVWGTVEPSRQTAEGVKEPGSSQRTKALLLSEGVVKRGAPELIDNAVLDIACDAACQVNASFAKQAEAATSKRGFNVKTDVNVKGQDPAGILPPDPAAFKKGVLRKFERKAHYKAIADMPDMTRGRMSFDDFSQVMAYSVQAGETWQVTEVTYPREASPEFVQRLKAVYGENNVSPHKVENGRYPRVHIDVVDSQFGIKHEWQMGTKAYNELLQSHIVALDPAVEAKVMGLDHWAVKDGKADFHLIVYDLFINNLLKHPEFARNPRVKKFMAEFEDTAIRFGGLNGEVVGGASAKATQVRLAGEASGIVDVAFREHPEYFESLGHVGNR